MLSIAGMKAATIAATAAVGLSLFGGVALAAPGANNGQAIGQDPVRLLLTKCSDAGVGNGGEFLIGFGPVGPNDNKVVLTMECKGERIVEVVRLRVALAIADSIRAQSDCIVLGDLDGFLAICEVDPGNSNDHNANPF